MATPTAPAGSWKERPDKISAPDIANGVYCRKIRQANVKRVNTPIRIKEKSVCSLIDTDIRIYRGLEKRPQVEY